MKLSDTEFEGIKASLNNAIHELVFACHHCEDDQIEEAQNALIAAGGTIDRVSQELAPFEP